MAENRVPCPNCADGFTTTGDRHARTRQDVCEHCAGTGMVEARTGQTPEASFIPGPSAVHLCWLGIIDGEVAMMGGQEHLPEFAADPAVTELVRMPTAASRFLFQPWPGRAAAIAALAGGTNG